MLVGIIGAGFAGLSTAKVLKRFGFDVLVFDKAPDVGGVWSATRRYPGLTTQNDKGTYALSDFPMPKSYPQWPSGQQVQEYLAAYARTFKLEHSLLLNTAVLHAQLNEADDTWNLDVRDVDTAETSTYTVDYLVVANGIFSEPFLPPYEGAPDYTSAGGRLCAASQIHDSAEVRGKDVVIVGYGKSACDVAVGISETAASTTVVARQLLWKMPKRLGKVLNYKYLMLTRMGEGLFRYITPRGFERFLHGRGKPVRDSMLGSVQSVAVKQLKLDKLGLVPEGDFERIGRSTVSLATDGFYERVKDGKIEVRRDCVITRLLEKNGRPAVELVTGEVLPADVVVCATGFRQEVPFFDAPLQRRLTDERGNFVLYRHIQPLDVPRLSFAGYNSSFFSPLSAEMAALWIVNYLIGGMDQPPVDERRRIIDERLRWMEERTEGHHARGTNVIPFSVHNIDEVLEDIGFNVSALTRAKQWLMPIDPGSYQNVTTRLLERQQALQNRPKKEPSA